MKDAKINASEIKVPSPAEIKQRRLNRSLKDILEDIVSTADTAVMNDVEKLVEGLQPAQMASALKNVLLKNMSAVRYFDVKSYVPAGEKKAHFGHGGERHGHRASDRFDDKKRFGDKKRFDGKKRDKQKERPHSQKPPFAGGKNRNKFKKA